MQSFDRLIGLSTSVTRWLDCFFIFGHFQHMIICPMEFKICQSKLKKLPNTKSTLLKWPKFFNVMPEWRNLAKSGHNAFNPSPLCLSFSSPKLFSVNKLGPASFMFRPTRLVLQSTPTNPLSGYSNRGYKETKTERGDK